MEGRVQIATEVMRMFFIPCKIFYQEILLLSSESQVSRIFLSFRAHFNSAVVLIALILPQISCSPGLFSRTLQPVQRTLDTSAITDTFMFHGFSISLVRSKYISDFSLSFIFTPWSEGTSNSLFHKFLSSVIFIKAGWFVFISNSLRLLCVSFLGQILVYA